MHTKVYIDLLGSSNNLKISSIVALSLTIVDSSERVTTHNYIFKPNHVLTTAQELKTGYSNGALRKHPPFIEKAEELLGHITSSELHFYDMQAERLWRKVLREIGYPMYKSDTVLEKQLKILKSDLYGLTLPELAFAFNFEGTINPKGHNSLPLYHCYENIGYSAFAKAKKEKLPCNNQQLPSSPGVYYFTNADGEIIYVGKAINIKKRVKSHFSSKLSFEKELCNATDKVTYEETGNELIALLKESQEIYALQPKYNTQQTEDINPWVIVKKVDAKGVVRLKPEEKSYENFEHRITFNRASVLQKLKLLQVLYRLCPRFIGLERTAGSCSNPKCLGVCRGEENLDQYNARAKKAFQELNEKVASYYLRLKGRHTGESAFILVKDNLYCGYGFIENHEVISSIEDLEAFLIKQPHTYYSSRSILNHLGKRGVEKVSF